jgi:hypothetical protein
VNGSDRTGVGCMMKSKKYCLMFLVLYLIALFLAGATQMHLPDRVLFKVLNFIWSLTPSQTARWFGFSLMVLVLLIILVFVAGCKLIVYFIREEKD